MPTLRDRGAALFLLAHDFAHLGQMDKATALLKECVSLEEGLTLSVTARIDAPTEELPFAGGSADPKGSRKMFTGKLVMAEL